MKKARSKIEGASTWPDDTHTRAHKDAHAREDPARPLAATGHARGAADVGRYQCPPPLCALRGSEKPPCAAVRAGCRGRVGLGPAARHHPPCLPSQAPDADSGRITSHFTSGARNLRYSPRGGGSMARGPRPTCGPRSMAVACPDPADP